MPTSFKNDAQLRALPIERSPYVASDEGCKGLVVRVYANGRKVFRWNARRIAGKINPLVLGEYGKPDEGGVTLAEARQKLEHARRKNSAGLDAVALLDRPKTVADLCEYFYRVRIQGRRDHPAKVRQVIDADIVPAIGLLPLSADLKTIHIRKPVLAAVDRGSPAHAKTVLATIKQMFGFAASHGFLEADISAPLKADDMGAREGTRDRVLSLDEIRWLWHAIDASPAKVLRQSRLALRLLLLIPTRTGELRRARWRDVDFKAATWTIPVEHQKSRKKSANLKPFTVPLTPAALELFRELSAITGQEYVLASPLDPTTPMDRQALQKALNSLIARENLDRAKNKIEPLAHFTPHDFRRTARTAMTDKLKIQPHVAELALTHSLGRIFRTYDLGSYMDERRAALQAWNDYIARIVADDGKVVELRA